MWQQHLVCSLVMCCMSSAILSASSTDEIGHRGNWRKKNEFYHDAKELLEEIEPYVETLAQKRPAFEEKERSGLTMLDNFYQQDGISREDVAFIDQSMQKYFDRQERLEQERIALEQDATEIEDSPIMLALSALRNRFNNFMIDLQELAVFESRIGEFMRTLETVIGDGGAALSIATDLVERIASIIDHTKAQEHFETLSAKRILVEELEDYLDRPFITAFDALLDLLAKRIESLRTQIDVLEKEDLFLRDRRMRLDEETARQDRIRAQLEAKREQESLAAQPWYTRLWRWLSSWFGTAPK